MQSSASTVVFVASVFFAASRKMREESSVFPAISFAEVASRSATAATSAAFSAVRLVDSATRPLCSRVCDARLLSNSDALARPWIIAPNVFMEPTSFSLNDWSSCRRLASRRSVTSRSSLALNSSVRAKATCSAL